jgi:hypothetical protein
MDLIKKYLITEEDKKDFFIKYSNYKIDTCVIGNYLQNANKEQHEKYFSLKDNSFFSMSDFFEESFILSTFGECDFILDGNRKYEIHVISYKKLVMVGFNTIELVGTKITSELFDVYLEFLEEYMEKFISYILNYYHDKEILTESDVYFKKMFNEYLLNNVFAKKIVFRNKIITF